jgi:hypothetical protein
MAEKNKEYTITEEQLNLLLEKVSKKIGDNMDLNQSVKFTIKNFLTKNCLIDKKPF